MNRVSGVVLFGALVLFSAACSKNPDVNVTTAAAGTGGTVAATATSIQVTPVGPFTLAVGGTQQLSATALDASGNPVTGVTFIWASGNGSVATVSGTGLVTAIAPGGPVMITASSGTITSNAVSITVSCTGIPSNTPTPLSVVLNPASPISVNATTSVAATVFDCNGAPVPDGVSVNFSLSSSTLGSLSPAFALTTGGGGTATVSFIASNISGTVTITAIAGTVSNSAALVINALPVGSIQFGQAVPQVIGVKGAGQVEVSEVSFNVNDTQGNPIADGSQTVRFEFLSGFNPGGGATIDPPSVSTVGGVAKTFLKSGYVAGPVRVLAYLDTNNNNMLDPGEIYSTSTPLSIGGGVPSMRFFSVSADVHNLAGLVYDGETANIIVNLADRFGNYNVLDGTSVSFYTEAGAIDRQNVTDNQGSTTVVLRTQNRWPFDTDPRQDLNPIGNEVLLYNNLDGDDRGLTEPYEDYNGTGIFTAVITAGLNGSLDTSLSGDDLVSGTTIIAGPNTTAETAATGDDVQAVTVGTIVGYDNGEHFSDLDGGGYDLFEPNPRDGWASVLAVTMGEETFYDLNGNGLYDAGEAFDDNGGEPFIDENDNGMYDDQESFTDQDFNGAYTPGEEFFDQGRGEPFLDVNNNGIRDATEPFTDLDGDLTYDAPGDAWYDVDGDGVFDAGEPCQDTNGNTTTCVTASDLGGFHNFVYDRGEFYVDVDVDGQWTHGNGTWDGNTAIWVDLRGTNLTRKKSQTIVFTGPPDFSLETSKIVIDQAHRDPRSGNGARYWINNGECANFTVYVADINNNAPIPGTTITFTADQGKLVGLSSIIVGDNSGGGPYITGVAVCDDDAAKEEVKASSLQVDVQWTPQNAGSQTYTMSAVGLKDAPRSINVTITSTTLPTASTTCATTPCYNFNLSAIGGAQPYTWTLIGGSMPQNFNVDSTGLITQNGGSSLTACPGSGDFTVQVTDVLGSTDSALVCIDVN